MSIKNIIQVTLLAATGFASMALVPDEALATWHNCNIDSVYEMPAEGEFQVHCTNATGAGIVWFALDLSDFDQAAEDRFMKMAMAAVLSGRVFRFNYTGTAAVGGIGREINKWGLTGVQN
jgi:hypothetical protein